jgi:hypothetical protein
VARKTGEEIPPRIDKRGPSAAIHDIPGRSWRAGGRVSEKPASATRSAWLSRFEPLSRPDVAHYPQPPTLVEPIRCCAPNMMMSLSRFKRAKDPPCPDGRPVPSDSTGSKGGGYLTEHLERSDRAPDAKSESRFPVPRKESDLNGPIVPYGQPFGVRQIASAARQPSGSRRAVVPEGLSRDDAQKEPTARLGSRQPLARRGHPHPKNAPINASAERAVYGTGRSQNPTTLPLHSSSIALECRPHST